MTMYIAIVILGNLFLPKQETYRLNKYSFFLLPSFCLPGKQPTYIPLNTMHEENTKQKENMHLHKNPIGASISS